MVQNRSFLVLALISLPLLLTGGRSWSQEPAEPAAGVQQSAAEPESPAGTPDKTILTLDQAIDL